MWQENFENFENIIDVLKIRDKIIVFRKNRNLRAEFSNP